MKSDAKTKIRSGDRKKKRSPLLLAKKSSAVKTLSKKPSAKKVLPKKRNNYIQTINLPIWRGINLTITFSLTRLKSKKNKSRKTVFKFASKYFTKKKELVVPSLFLLGGLFGIVFFGLQATFSAPPSLAVSSPFGQREAAAPISMKSNVLARSQPVELTIPSIELSSTLSVVGKTSDGEIEVPKDYTKAGWYRFSPTPGELGPAIIVGHLDNIYGQAVFWRLSELVPGQIIKISRQDKKIAKFVVTHVKQFPQNNFPTDEVYGDLDYAGLRLITCGGTFNYLTQHYSDNTVVFASLVDE